MAGLDENCCIPRNDRIDRTWLCEYIYNIHRRQRQLVKTPNEQILLIVIGNRKILTVILLHRKNPEIKSPKNKGFRKKNYA